MTLNEFLTPEVLLSFQGMILICWIVVQVVKGLIDKAFNHVVTFRIVLLTAAILTGLKTLYEWPHDEKGFSIILMSIVLWIINTGVVALAAMAAHEKIAQPVINKLTHQ
mgnify:CR=1 FL=1